MTRVSQGGVTRCRLIEQLANDAFVIAMLRQYYRHSTITLTTLARELANAMLFARAIGLRADAKTVSCQGRQLVLTAQDDVEHTARMVVEEEILGCALEHARQHAHLIYV